MKPFKDRLLVQLEEMRSYQQRQLIAGTTGSHRKTVPERAYAMIAEEVLGWVVTWAEAQPNDPSPEGTDTGHMVETLRRIADKLEAAV